MPPFIQATSPFGTVTGGQPSSFGGGLTNFGTALSLLNAEKAKRERDFQNSIRLEQAKNDLSLKSQQALNSQFFGQFNPNQGASPTPSRLVPGVTMPNTGTVSPAVGALQDKPFIMGPQGSPITNPFFVSPTKRKEQELKLTEEKLSRATTLRKEFRQSPAFKDFNEIKRASSVIEAAFNQSIDPNTKDKLAADQALVTAFNKMLDPGSVVRESEFARTPQGQAFISNIQGRAQQLFVGGVGLTEQGRAELKSMADAILRMAVKDVNREVDVFSNLATSFNVPEELIFGGFNNQLKSDVKGQGFVVEAESEDQLPEIVDTIIKQQQLQGRPDVSGSGVAPDKKFVGSIENPPSFKERALRSLPNIGQFGGGLFGGIGAAGLTKSAPIVQTASAIGGTGGRAIGKLGEFSLREMAESPEGALAVITLGPIGAFMARGTPEEKELFKRDIKRTAGVEAGAGLLGFGATKFLSSVGDNIASAILGDRVAGRLKERGFSSILDPENFKGRFPKQIAQKVGSFFEKLSDVTGKQTSKAISKSGVGDKAIKTAPLKQEILGVETRLGAIDDFSDAVSIAQKKILKKQRDEILALGDEVSVSELWEIRKKFDKLFFGKSFADEADDYFTSFRRIINAPVRNSSKEVATSFDKYAFVMDQNKKLGKKLSVEQFQGETFATQPEPFFSNLLKTNKDEQIRLLKQLDSFLDADDRVIEQALDVAAAEAIDKPIELMGIGSRIVAGTLGGRRRFAELGQALHSPAAEFSRRAFGRFVPTGIESELERIRKE